MPVNKTPTLPDLEFPSMKYMAVAIYMIVLSYPVHAEEASCEKFRGDLQQAYNGMEITGPAMNSLMSKPGIAAAIQRKKIAEKGLRFANIAESAILSLSANKCLDFAGRETDWSTILNEARQISRTYATQAGTM